MKFIHQREHLEEGDIVVIQCSQTCNIRLMNDANFRSFKNGGRHTYHGGAFDRFPAKIVAPSSGFWNITLTPLLAPDQRDAQTEPHLFHQGHSTVGVAFIDAAPARNHPAGAKI